jgi:hypothetical protein
MEQGLQLSARFVAGILAAAEVLEHGQLQEGLAGLGERVIGLSMNGG